MVHDLAFLAIVARRESCLFRCVFVGDSAGKLVWVSIGAVGSRRFADNLEWCLSSGWLGRGVVVRDVLGVCVVNPGPGTIARLCVSGAV